MVHGLFLQLPICVHNCDDHSFLSETGYTYVLKLDDSLANKMSSFRFVSSSCFSIFAIFDTSYSLLSFGHILKGIGKEKRSLKLMWKFTGYLIM